jgi:hypothetical protein
MPKHEIAPYRKPQHQIAIAPDREPPKRFFSKRLKIASALGAAGLGYLYLKKRKRRQQEQLYSAPQQYEEEEITSQPWPKWVKKQILQGKL